MGGQADAGIDLAVPRVGRPGRYKWTFAAIWLIYMADPVVKVVHADRSPEWKLLNYAVTALFVVVYGALAFVIYPRDGDLGTPLRTPRVAWPLLAGLGAIATVSTLWINYHMAGMWVYVGVGTGLTLPLADGRAYRGCLVVFGLMTLCVLPADGIGLTDWAELALPTFFAGLSTIGIRQLAVVIGELREARETVARLAASEERLRLARDLHDLTGHSLSVITLKAELAQRMLRKTRDLAPQAPPPGLDAALKEVEDIEQVSRQSLTDIRKAVSGYRRATLVVEMASAYAALEAADIKLDADASVAVATGVFAPEAEAALAWSLREAVTNVIRHSAASRVTVDLRRTGGEAVLTVRNDGRGLAAAAGQGDGFGGNGLAGLRERLDAVGGRLSIGGPDGDFRLVAAVPDRESEAAADGGPDREADRAAGWESEQASGRKSSSAAGRASDSESGGASDPVAIG
ncbi:MAG: sensor histidine kinase [Catenulispora sp.]|nr:sensor histidine kinase [Catenulispora sp.]